MVGYLIFSYCQEMTFKNMFYLIDTKTTQWDDPRLQNSAITGPVSIEKIKYILVKLLNKSVEIFVLMLMGFFLFTGCALL